MFSSRKEYFHKLTGDYNTPRILILHYDARKAIRVHKKFFICEDINVFPPVDANVLPANLNL